MSQGRSEPGRGAPRRTARIVLLIAAIAVLATAGVVLTVVVVPPALANLSTRVEESDTKVEVGRVSLTVPAGWAVRRSPLRPDALLLTSPDGRLDVGVSASTAAPAQAFADAVPDATDRIQEPLASGLAAVHARTAENTIIAAVGDDDGAAVLVATARGDIGNYTSALADLFETTRVAPSATEASR